jgi:TonB family protein
VFAHDEQRPFPVCGAPGQSPPNKTLQLTKNSVLQIDAVPFWHQPSWARRPRRRYSTPLNADPLGSVRFQPVRNSWRALLLSALASGFAACQTSLPPGCPNWPNENDYVIPIYRELPLYPRSAQRDGVGGYVTMEAVISRAGRVESAEVVESVPPGVFDRPALKALRAWRYCPLTADAPDYPNPTTVRLEFGSR